MQQCVILQEKQWPLQTRRLGRVCNAGGLQLENWRHPLSTYRYYKSQSNDAIVVQLFAAKSGGWNICEIPIDEECPIRNCCKQWK